MYGPSSSYTWNKELEGWISVYDRRFVLLNIHRDPSFRNCDLPKARQPYASFLGEQNVYSNNLARGSQGRKISNNRNVQHPSLFLRCTCFLLDPHASSTRGGCSVRAMDSLCARSLRINSKSDVVRNSLRTSHPSILLLIFIVRTFRSLPKKSLMSTNTWVG